MNYRIIRLFIFKMCLSFSLSLAFPGFLSAEENEDIFKDVDCSIVLDSALAQEVKERWRIHDAKDTLVENPPFEELSELLSEEKQKLKQELIVFHCLGLDVKDRVGNQIPKAQKELNKLRWEYSMAKVRAKVEQERVKQLLRVDEFLKDLSMGLEENNRIFETVIDLSDAAQVAHLDWLEEYQALVERQKPDVDNIIDSESYYQELSKVYAYFSQLPSTESVDQKESTVIFHIKDQKKRAQVLIERMRQILHNADYKYYLKFNGNTKSSEEIKGHIAMLESNIVNISKTQKLIELKRRKRDALAKGIYNRWFDAITTTAVLALSTDILQEYNQMLASEGMIIRVSNLLTERNRGYTDRLRRYMSPILAKRSVMASQSYLTKLEQKIDESFISEEYKNEIQILIAHYRKVFRANLIQTERAIDQYEKYNNERKRIAERYLARYENMLTEKCKNIADLVINSELVNEREKLEHEKLYIVLRTKCFQ